MQPAKENNKYHFKYISAYLIGSLAITQSGPSGHRVEVL